MSLQKQNYDYLINPDGTYPFIEPGGGIKGSKGATGTDGAKGQKGEPGVDGTDGTDGTKGQKGDRGFTGLKGQKGEASSTVFNFEGQVPTFADLPATGNTEGDVYQLSSNQDLYVWDGTTWLLLAADVEAVKGDDGVKGQKGDQGQKGATGADGTDGTDGTNGTKGNKGQKGASPSTDEFVTKTAADQTYVQLATNNELSGYNSFLDPGSISPTVVIQRSTTNRSDQGNQTIASFKVQGCIKGSQNLNSDLLKTYSYPISYVDGVPNPDGQPQSDIVRYFGQTGVPESIQTRSSCDARYVALTGAQSIAGVKTFSNTPVFSDGLTARSPSTFYNSSGSGGEAIRITQMNGTVETGAWRSNGNIEVNELEAAATATFAGNCTIATAKKLTINRGTPASSTGGLVINGMTTAGVNSNILDCFYNSGTAGDAINYHGLTSNANNLQNKDSVDAAIAAALNPDWVTLTLASGVSGSAKYRIIGGSIVQLVFTVNRTGSDVEPGRLLFTMPSAARPSQNTNFVGNPKGAGTSTAQGSFVMIGVTSNDGQVKVLSNDYQLTVPSLKTDATVNNLIPASSSGNVGPQDIHGAVMWALT